MNERGVKLVTNLIEQAQQAIDAELSGVQSRLGELEKDVKALAAMRKLLVVPARLVWKPYVSGLWDCVARGHRHRLGTEDELPDTCPTCVYLGTSVWEFANCHHQITLKPGDQYPDACPECEADPVWMDDKSGYWRCTANGHRYLMEGLSEPLEECPACLEERNVNE